MSVDVIITAMHQANTFPYISEIFYTITIRHFGRALEVVREKIIVIFISLRVCLLVSTIIMYKS